MSATTRTKKAASAPKSGKAKKNADGSGAKRVIGRPFRKGQSGNPGGMPKGTAEIKELARVHSADAIATIAKIMRDEAAPHAARVMAAERLLDRGFGKPKQFVEASVSHFVEEMSREELEAYVIREAEELGFSHAAAKAVRGARVSH